MGDSDSNFPKHYYYQSFGMSKRMEGFDDEASSESSSGGFSVEDNNSSNNSRSPPLPSSPPASSTRVGNHNEQDNDEESHDNGVGRSFFVCTTKGGLLLEQILFFLAGLGSSIGYIATLSSLVYFKILFGANSFVYLNCAVFLPLLPISLAQAIWDSRFDLLWQSRVTFLVRGVLGYGFVMIGTLGMVAFARNNHYTNGEDGHASGMEWVIFWALLQGIGGAVLFGQLNQLASFVGSLHQNHTTGTTGGNGESSNTAAQIAAMMEENESLPKKFKATVSAGVQASALVVLLASITSGFGTMNQAFFARFLQRIFQVEVVCFLACLWLLLARPRIQVSMMRRDSSMRELAYSPLSSDTDPETAHLRLPLLPSPPTSPNGSEDAPAPTMLSLRALLYHSRMACLAMALTLVPSFLVGSWFTRVQTDWMELAQVLFYVRIGSDLTGRFATIWIPPPSIECVVLTAGLRCIAVVVFFVNANASSRIPLDSSERDALSIGLVALIAFCSGYLVTSCYQLAPQLLPGTPTIRAANVAEQSSLLTVAFSLSAIGGLVTSFVLVALGV